jgi:hypothetical protein
LVKPGEIVVHSDEPEPGKCYNYLFAQRKALVGKEKYKYFTSEEPKYKYAGKFLYKAPWSNGTVQYTFTDSNRKDVTIKDRNGLLCFLETECVKETEQTFNTSYNGNRNEKDNNDDVKKRNTSRSRSRRSRSFSSRSGSDDSSCDDTVGHIDSQPGDKIHGRYTVVKQLGIGTFGKVLQCDDSKHGDSVAIKVIRKIEKYEINPKDYY